MSNEQSKIVAAILVTRRQIAIEQARLFGLFNRLEKSCES